MKLPAELHLWATRPAQLIRAIDLIGYLQCIADESGGLAMLCWARQTDSFACDLYVHHAWDAVLKLSVGRSFICELQVCVGGHGGVVGQSVPTLYQTAPSAPLVLATMKPILCFVDSSRT